MREIRLSPGAFLVFALCSDVIRGMCAFTFDFIPLIPNNRLKSKEYIALIHDSVATNDNDKGIDYERPPPKQGLRRGTKSILRLRATLVNDIQLQGHPSTLVMQELYSPQSRIHPDVQC